MSDCVNQLTDGQAFWILVGIQFLIMSPVFISCIYEVFFVKDPWDP